MFITFNVCLLAPRAHYASAEEVMDTWTPLCMQVLL